MRYSTQIKPIDYLTSISHRPIVYLGESEARK
jgi:hypothetical protein